MNSMHLHLMINHFPVVGLIGTIFLFTYAVIGKSKEVQKLSLASFIIIALISFAVFFSGQAAAEGIKKLNLPGVTNRYIDMHEEMADLAVVLIALLGITSMAGLFLTYRKGSMPTWLLIVVMAMALLTAVVVGFTANLGGEIRHTEIRSL